MQTYRSTVSSVLVATMSVCACLLLAEAPAYAKATVISRAQNACLIEKYQHASDAQSKLHVAGDQQPPLRLADKGLSASSIDRDVSADFSIPAETFCALLSKYLSSN